MSELRIPLVAAAALSGAVLLAITLPAAAQDPRAELAARIDSLAGIYEAQLEQVRVLDSIRLARLRELRTDTTVVGPFVVIDRDTVPVQRLVDALTAAWSRHAAFVGHAVRRIEGTIVTMTLPPAFTPAGGAGQYRFEPFVWGSADYERAARHVMSSVLTDALPADLREWLDGGSVLPGGSLEWPYRELATAHSHAARNCFAGDVAACIAASGLTDPGEDWSRWYTPGQLRAQVAQRSWYSGAAGACVHQLDDAACIAESRRLGGALPPLGGAARASLLASALELGGTGAYARLFDDAPDVGARLANAAGLPLDEVVASWREAVERARPSIHAGMLDAGIWTVILLAALAVLAMRSTRWRLG
ncbi:MAG TPA: hypothetical protein VFZ24_01725 [Longimicrobiales bacterium]